MNDVINEAVDQIIVNLKTLGKLRINDKLFIQNGYIMIHKDTFMRPFVRTVYGYSREQSCVLIQENIQKAIRVTNNLIQIKIQKIQENQIEFMNYIKILHHLRESFCSCLQGLANFMKTYSEDTTINSRIENLLVHIQNQLSIIDSRLTEPSYQEILTKFFPQQLEQYIVSRSPIQYQTFHQNSPDNFYSLSNTPSNTPQN